MNGSESNYSAGGMPPWIPLDVFPGSYSHSPVPSLEDTNRQLVKENADLLNQLVQLTVQLDKMLSPEDLFKHLQKTPEFHLLLNDMLGKNEELEALRISQKELQKHKSELLRIKTILLQSRLENNISESIAQESRPQHDLLNIDTILNDLLNQLTAKMNVQERRMLMLDFEKSKLWEDNHILKENIVPKLQQDLELTKKEASQIAELQHSLQQALKQIEQLNRQCQNQEKTLAATLKQNAESKEIIAELNNKNIEQDNELMKLREKISNLDFELKESKQKLSHLEVADDLSASWNDLSTSLSRSRFLCSTLALTKEQLQEKLLSQEEQYSDMLLVEKKRYDRLMDQFQQLQAEISAAPEKKQCESDERTFFIEFIRTLDTKTKKEFSEQYRRKGFSFG